MESLSDWTRTSPVKIEHEGYMIYKNQLETGVEYQAWRPISEDKKQLIGIFSTPTAAIRDCCLDAQAIRSSN